MNENRLIDYLDHIRQAVHDACGFLDGMSKAEFLSDKRSQQAVIMSLIIIGQAVTKVMDRDPAFAARHSQIPLAQHARHAQPNHPRVFRHQPRCGLGYRAVRTAGVASSPGGRT